ncbi:MAG: hypothetical protein LBG64_02140 [Pseudomonadales bacterium]|jgi:hypothetical protein|nr:hypothetical protein [Pseudomonadales bacterium]
MPVSKEKKYKKAGIRAVVWLVAFCMATVTLGLFLNLELFMRDPNVANIAAQNRIRQVLDENYHDWESTTLENYAPFLANAIGATWTTAFQIWPSINDYFSERPIVVMYAGMQNAWFFYPDGRFEERADYALRNNLLNLSVGTHFINDLEGVIDGQSTLVQVIDRNVFSDIANQSRQWISAPLPGNLYANITEQKFRYAQLDLAETQYSEPQFNNNALPYPINTGARRLRLEILAALQAAYDATDISRQENHLDRAAFFYHEYLLNFPNDADLQRSADINLGNSAYFALQMRLRASHHKYDPYGDFQTFINRVVRTDLSLERFAINITENKEAQWLGIFSGLILDRNGVTGWRQNSVQNNYGALDQLLGNRFTERTFSYDTRVTRVFERSVVPFWQHKNQTLERHQLNFNNSQHFLVMENTVDNFLDGSTAFSIGDVGGEHILTRFNNNLHTLNGHLVVANTTANFFTNNNELSNLCGNVGQNIFLAIDEGAITYASGSDRQIVVNVGAKNINILARENIVGDNFYYCPL